MYVDCSSGFLFESFLDVEVLRPRQWLTVLHSHIHTDEHSQASGTTTIATTNYKLRCFADGADMATKC